jgi:ABC-type Mn2+/Zn2+ transport system permease subunit
LEALLTYGWALVGATLLGCALAWIGAHVVTRGATIQALCVSQGAELGILVAIVLVLFSGGTMEGAPSWAGFLGAILGACLCGGLAGAAERVRLSSRTVVLFGFWLVLVSGTQVLVALHPLLESHYSGAFLGDLTTLGDRQAKLVIIFSGVFLIWLVSCGRSLATASFDCAVLLMTRTRTHLSQSLVFLLASAFATWSMGFLFTCACLFLPTSLMSVLVPSSARVHVLLCTIVAAVAVPLGFVLSVLHGSLPTVPTIAVIVIVVASITWIFARKILLFRL